MTQTMTMATIDYMAPGKVSIVIKIFALFSSTSKVWITLIITKLFVLSFVS